MRKPKAMLTVICKCCGTPFETRKTNQYFCPVPKGQCHKVYAARQREQARADRPPIEKECEYCGDKFTVDKVDTAGRRVGENTKYCPDKPCGAKANTKKKVNANRVALGLPEDQDGRSLGRLKDKTIERIAAIRTILDPNNPVGVRFCCYHLLSIGLLESTKQFPSMYPIVTAARHREPDDPHYLPDNCFVDHTRTLEFDSGYEDIEDFVSYLTSWYRRNHWQTQKVVPIIVCEKRGHGDILKGTCDKEHVRLFLSRGTLGRSFLVDIAEHVADVINNGQRVRIGYIGDHDASGRQIEKTAQYGNTKKGSPRRDGVYKILKDKHDIDAHNNADIDWTRLALTQEQFENLPEIARVPVKHTDNNADKYVAMFGEFGGEVEALTRETLQELVRDFIEGHKDQDLWEESRRIEQSELRRLSKAII